MEYLTPGNKIDDIAKLAAVAFFILWNLSYGAPIHTRYPIAFVSLYEHPIWRFLLVGFMIAAISWCPRVGLMVAFALFFYLMDMQHFTKPWNSR